MVSDFEKWVDTSPEAKDILLTKFQKKFQVFSEQELAELLAEFAEDFQNEINHTRYGFKDLALRFLKEKEGKK